VSGADGLIVVSAADSGYFLLLQDAVASVRALNGEVAVGVLDLGLAETERDWLAPGSCDRAGMSIFRIRRACRGP